MVNGFGGRNFEAYSFSTGFPFFQNRNFSKIWENLFESYPRALLAARSTNDKTDIRKMSVSIVGSGGRIRTYDQCVNSALLYH